MHVCGFKEMCLFLCVWVFSLYVGKSASGMDACGGQKRVLYPLGLELQTMWAVL